MFLYKISLRSMDFFIFAAVCRHKKDIKYAHTHTQKTDYGFPNSRHIFIILFDKQLSGLRMGNNR